MSEPTKAAMRASQKIFPMRGDKSQKSFAEIIDRETGLPELLAALKNLRETCRDAGRLGAVAIADNALRKAGEL